MHSIFWKNPIPIDRTTVPVSHSLVPHSVLTEAFTVHKPASLGSIEGIPIMCDGLLSMTLCNAIRVNR